MSISQEVRLIDDELHILPYEEKGPLWPKSRKSLIDEIQKYPKIKKLSIAGLDQNLFNYFIENYAHTFTVISFKACKRVKDFSKMEELSNIESVEIFWNQKAENLWDFSKTLKLKSLKINSIKKLSDFGQIENGKLLKYIRVIDNNTFNIDNKIKSLRPFIGCENLEEFMFYSNIIDKDISPLKDLKKIKKITFAENQFTTEQIAWLKAQFKINGKEVDCKQLEAFMSVDPIIEGAKDTIIVGKRKPFLQSKTDEEKIKKYEKKFNDMYNWFCENPSKKPENY